jgi:valyl-tRNA synthetase
VEWFDAMLDKTIEQVNQQFDAYNVSEALMVIYKLFWDEFSSWYLEAVKPGFNQPIDSVTFNATIGYFEKLLKLLHPYMPFITEEIYHLIAEREVGDCIMVSLLPQSKPYSSSLLEEFDNLKETVTNIRSIRQDKNIPQKDALELFVKRDGVPTIDLSSVICKMANLTAITHTESKVEGASSFLVKTTEFFLPLGGLLNVEEELNKLSAELTYLQGFLVSVNKKLSNSSFVNNAPAKVVEVEQNKKADAESKIKAIMGQLAQLKK